MERGDNILNSYTWTGRAFAPNHYISGSFVEELSKKRKIEKEYSIGFIDIFLSSDI